MSGRSNEQASCPLFEAEHLDFSTKIGNKFSFALYMTLKSPFS